MLGATCHCVARYDVTHRLSVMLRGAAQKRLKHVR